MANIKITKDMLTTNQFNTYKFNSQLLEFYRSNPIIACEDLLGIKLLDYQAYLVQQTWNSQFSLWCLTRNGAKTVTGAIVLMLFSALYENQKIFIVSSNGKQAKNMFNYIQKLATNKISEFTSLKDIYYDEIYRSQQHLSGFSHSPESFEVTMLNGSKINTLNGNPDGNRSFRSDVIFFDECGFMSDEQITVVEAFATTESSFKTSTEEFFDTRVLNKEKPSQIIYASSASDKETLFYKKYREFALRQFAGDKRYFVMDINVEVPLNPTLGGKPYAPLLERSKVEAMMNTNPNKARREYFNLFDADGGDDQIIKSHVILRNSTFVLPEVSNVDGGKYIFAYDPSSQADNSAFAVMRLCHDEKRGYYGKIVNCVTFKDLAIAKGNKQMLYPEQLEKIREYMLIYNGDAPDYENIQKLVIDQGSGGGGSLYSGSLLYDFKDKNGIEHRGMTDKEFYAEEKQKQFPNAYPVVRMVEPTKWKSTMATRLVDLMDLGLIEFPVEYNNSGTVLIDDDSEEDGVVQQNLSKEEALALMNIDIMKEEAKMIHRYRSGEKYIYKTRVDMASKVKDDRYDVLALLANELHIIRENYQNNKHKTHKPKNKSVLRLFN